MKIAAIIQVRMGSIRLPGKSLSDIAGQSLLAHFIDRGSYRHHNRPGRR